MAIVIVNYETRRLVSQLIFSLYRILGRGSFALILVVDNGSRDGSVETLTALQDADLLYVVRNARHRYHGPALNQALSWLSRRQARVAASERIDYVWVLDSDVVVLRPAVVRDALGVFRSGAAIVGQDRALLDVGDQPVGLYSLMFDPAKIWRRELPPFHDEGNPSDALQLAALRMGLRIGLFPFISHSYVLHLGRGTLNQLAQLGIRDNRFYEWGVGRQYHHYSNHPLGPQLHAEVLRRYEKELRSDSPEDLVRACRRESLYHIDGVDSLPPVRQLIVEALATGVMKECPKCGYARRAEIPECPSCGSWTSSEVGGG